MLRFVKARVRKTADAEVILQEIWYQFSRVSNIEDLGNAGAWLYAVTRNKITDSYRKKKNESLEELTEARDEDSFPITHLLIADDTANPELKMFKEIFWDELMKALVHASFEDGVLTVILQKDHSKIKASQEVPVS